MKSNHSKKRRLNNNTFRKNTQLKQSKLGKKNICCKSLHKKQTNKKRIKKSLKRQSGGINPPDGVDTQAPWTYTDENGIVWDIRSEELRAWHAVVYDAHMLDTYDDTEPKTLIWRDPLYTQLSKREIKKNQRMNIKREKAEKKSEKNRLKAISEKTYQVKNVLRARLKRNLKNIAALKEKEKEKEIPKFIKNDLIVPRLILSINTPKDLEKLFINRENEFPKKKYNFNNDTFENLIQILNSDNKKQSFDDNELFYLSETEILKYKDKKYSIFININFLRNNDYLKLFKKIEFYNLIIEIYPRKKLNFFGQILSLRKYFNMLENIDNKNPVSSVDIFQLKIDKFKKLIMNYIDNLKFLEVNDSILFWMPKSIKITGTSVTIQGNDNGSDERNVFLKINENFVNTINDFRMALKKLTYRFYLEEDLEDYDEDLEDYDKDTKKKPHIIKIRAYFNILDNIDERFCYYHKTFLNNIIYIQENITHFNKETLGKGVAIKDISFIKNPFLLSVTQNNDETYDLITVEYEIENYNLKFIHEKNSIISVDDKVIFDYSTGEKNLYEPLYGYKELDAFSKLNYHIKNLRGTLKSFKNFSLNSFNSEQEDKKLLCKEIFKEVFLTRIQYTIENIIPISYLKNELYFLEDKEKPTDIKFPFNCFDIEGDANDYFKLFLGQVDIYDFNNLSNMLRATILNHVCEYTPQIL